jgi:hypothetical protein
MSLTYYQPTLRKIPRDGRSQLHCGGVRSHACQTLSNTRMHLNGTITYKIVRAITPYSETGVHKSCAPGRRGE